MIVGPHRSVARTGTVLIGQFDWGGLLPKSNGGAPWYPRPGRQSGNRSANVEGCLTASPMGRAGTKVGVSDPAVLDGKAVAQQIKGTPGITGLSPLSVHSGEEVWHLDVGSSHPGAGEGPKGLAVRQLKRYVSWVQTVVRQVGLNLLQALILEGICF